jgi:hypothetical protein
MYFYEQVLYEREPPNIRQFDLNQYERNLPQQVKQKEPIQQDRVPMQQQMLQPNQQQQPEEQLNNDLEQQQYIDAQEQSDALISISISIKKYFLIRRLFALNDKLNQLRVKNDILNIVINFVDSFSYESLLLITKKLIEEITTQIKSNEQIEDT